MRRKYIFVGITLLVVLLPFWMWMAWLVTPKKKLVVAIVDKTVMSQDGQEHVSLSWVLNQEKFTKTHTKGYAVGNDYFGFFPMQKEQFRIKGLERFSTSQLDQLSRDADLTYYTDTYGIYTNEWFAKKNITERSGIIYGGMSREDVYFLQKMKERKKLIIAEFNSIGSPTSDETRGVFENMFGLKWTGWIGRYFNSLDTAENKEIPRWLIKDYERMHQGHWPFKLSGIAFVNNQDEVAIIEEETHLNNPLPYITSSDYGEEAFGLPPTMKYSFWFDIVIPDTTINTVIAQFDLDVNEKGAKELAQNGIPTSIPAVTMHKGSDYQFYYFSGDFCDNPLSITSSYFKGIGGFQSFFYKESDKLERQSFFWKFYRPMLTSIFRNYYNSKRP